MSNAVVRILKTPDLRKKIGFTLFIVLLFRLGSFVPTPYVDYSAVKQCINQTSQTSGLYELVNLFSGGALLQLSVFAMGIMPYITASIIVQLLRVVIPRFEELHKEGESGRAKMTQYTRYLALGLGLLQATTLVTVARTGALYGTACSESLIVNDQWYTIVLMVLTMTAGTGLIMWFGELITERGIGNGMSLLIFTSIAAQFPSQMGAIWNGNGGPRNFFFVLILALVLVVAVVFVEQSQRRVPVQYAKRVVGRRTYGGNTTYIPIKVNMAGVVPVIFASSLLYLPALIAQFNQGDGSQEPPAWVQFISNYLTRGDHPLYMALYFLLIVGFTYFYVAITFNPEEQAENLKKYGGFIPGIRAGRPTADFLNYVLSRITFPGSIYLGLVALLPLIVLGGLGVGQNFAFGGTSILIIVGVGLETVKQINSQLQQRHYEGLLK
ncbi:MULTISPECIES: preprotein translocase subunit SecY [unclassified Pseudoclavibacter]|uniref:preprotein translocase subunit SecY n=1 Tax=unclassified Pseudoclavibacter TaxID=2615177 RepID=UPI0013017ED4|nr:MULTISPECIES: preprotein translocase subunit SecY [unclassified Pseudoclavibacter]KAB1658929.1 preprotein translocase subunit SecY [Pseudoclavibacter sp. CFCC 11306]KAB1661038.1 preprotein translocase subunit SecY [Pseudoclavibacter sp. CFCC 13796]